MHPQPSLAELAGAVSRVPPVSGLFQLEPPRGAPTENASSSVRGRYTAGILTQTAGPRPGLHASAANFVVDFSGSPGKGTD